MLLPPRRKSEPPRGYTGGSAIEPSFADAYSWSEDSPEGNIALHMPRNVLGIDVDRYHGGGPTMEAAVKRWGRLPPTWYPSARDDGSGIRLYRIPEGLRWPGKLEGGGVETVHSRHRYAVVPASIHPDTGTPYLWHLPNREIAPPHAVPSPDSLPDLPDTWIEGLTHGVGESELSDRAGLTLQQSVDWLDQGEMCAFERRILDEGKKSLTQDSASRHDSALTCIYALIGAVANGHTGGRVAINLLAADYIKAITHASGGGRIVDEDEATREFQRMVHGAVDKLYVEQSRAPRDPCKDPLREIAAMFSDDAIAEQRARMDQEQEARARQANRDLGIPDARTPTPIEHTLDSEEEVEQGPDERPGARIRAHILRRSQLDSLPEPEPMIEGVLMKHAYMLLVGRDASYKSFLALDWALCLATGKAWQNHPTRPCNVLYLAAEGAYGMKARTRSWEQAWNSSKTVPDAAFAMYPYPVNLAKPEAAQELIDYIGAEDFGLVVVDTLGRSVTGVNQNAGESMSIVTENLDSIWRATRDGSVLVVAHTDKPDNDSRGYSGIEDDSSLVWHVKRLDETSSEFVLHNRKMKDGPTHVDMALYTAEIDDSLVILGGDPGKGGELERQQRENQKSMIVSQLWQMFENTGGASMTQITARMNELNLSPSTTRRRMDEMVTEGLVFRPDPGSNGRGNYVLTDKGRVGRAERMGERAE